ncbi:MAG: hypothetical protein MPN21_25185 [Thermoanaerobaculia bacterium]|nr:hypothetical protein [Thermoanaerobaculia bacterium]
MGELLFIAMIAGIAAFLEAVVLGMVVWLLGRCLLRLWPAVPLIASAILTFPGIGIVSGEWIGAAFPIPLATALLFYSDVAWYSALELYWNPPTSRALESLAGMSLLAGWLLWLFVQRTLDLGILSAKRVPLGGRRLGQRMIWDPIVVAIFFGVLVCLALFVSSAIA